MPKRPSQQLTDAMNAIEPFYKMVGEFGTTLPTLDTMQVNIGLKCNFACKHCHLMCSPKSTEEMSRETLEACLEAFHKHNFKTLDITGGAPELNENFEWFITEARKSIDRVMVRSNLAILEEDGFGHLYQKYADLGIVIIASLPHYRKKNSEKQRGLNTFEPTITALQKLCKLGYGKEGSGLELNLVFNPQGAVMSPSQSQIEREYRGRLESDFGIVFNNLFTINNCPIGRFGDRLVETGNFEGYMSKLTETFNPDTLPGTMCRSQVSVGWDGQLYDCDFNYAIDLPIKNKSTIFDLAKSDEQDMTRDIMFWNHCYVCTAGAGSS